jgi:hypothetical protein
MHKIVLRFFMHIIIKNIAATLWNFQAGASLFLL